MLKWLKRTLTKSEEAPQQTDERALGLEREVQSLRLELEEREQSLVNLKSELERHRNTESARIADAVQAQIERLMTDAAAPVAQLLTQAHLLEAESKPLQAKDVLAVAKRFIRALEDQGLKLEGSVGEAVAFDPNRHEPLNRSASINQGQQVVTRFVGISYCGKFLRKTGVELRKGQEEKG
jgi:molecular chaperone GrpE (heat shock protein)